jgi:hypothetical protein
MSGVSNFLAKQKKAELTELADSLGVEYAAPIIRCLRRAWLTVFVRARHDGLKKTELELELEDYLTKNSAKYSSDSRFTSFYKRRPDSSPVKKEAGSALSDVESKAKQVRRRVTKAAEDGAT